MCYCSKDVAIGCMAKGTINRKDLPKVFSSLEVVGNDRINTDHRDPSITRIKGLWVVKYCLKIKSKTAILIFKTLSQIIALAGLQYAIIVLRKNPKISILIEIDAYWNPSFVRDVLLVLFAIVICIH